MEENKSQENPFFKILQKAEELMKEQERNTARNAEISQEIANLVGRVENATKNVKGIELGLNETDKKSIQSIKDNFSLFKTLKYVIGAMLLISALTLLGSGYMAKKWYNTSVQTKQEVRGEVLKQISDEGSIIVSKAEYTALRHEKELLKGWYEANPEDRKSYNTHRKAIINLEQNQERLFFESPASDEIGKGGKSGFFD